MMRASKIIKQLGLKIPSGFTDFKVKGISCNSRQVKSGFIFVAVKGAKEDGNKFIADALKKGAKLIVCSAFSPQPSAVSKIFRFKDTRKVAAQLASEFYGHPADKMKFIGVTGTNGKTTITYLIEAMLKVAKKNPAVIGTINYRFNKKIVPARNTTPGPVELQKLFNNMRKGKVTHVVMEVSSHALDQERTEGINFKTAVFTNLTQDHLDYHKNMEAYFQAKLKLFKNLSSKSVAVINNDDPYALRVKNNTKAKIITYGIDKKSDIMAKKIEFTSNHTDFLLSIKNKEIKLRTKLIGRHNLYNILATIAVSLEEGVSLKNIVKALTKCIAVPGRLQALKVKSGFTVFVDYAHTEDALKNVITSLRGLSEGKIIVVFGCGGDRDKTKRPKMGAAVTGLADYAIITNDNPRSEEPGDIISDIKKGIKRDNFEVIIDRKNAIKKSLNIALSNDIVLIAGKGHEHYQILKNKTIDFDDYQVVKECLQSLN